MMWSSIGYTKPSNWASATGFMPCAARPTDRPAMVVSSSGVSSTRCGPNFCCRPAVARNTPPLTPTSSPSTSTDGSCSSSHARARVIASIRVIGVAVGVWLMGCSPPRLAWTGAESPTPAAAWAPARLLLSARWLRMSSMALLQGNGRGALREQVRRRIGVEVVEHRFHRLRGGGQVGVDLGVDLALALGLPLGLLGLAPGALRGEPGAQARDRLALPGGLDLGVVAVAARVVGGGVVGQAVGEELDHRAALAGARAVHGLAHRVEHGDQVVAVDLQHVQAAGDALLRQGLGA